MRWLVVAALIAWGILTAGLIAAAKPGADPQSKIVYFAMPHGGYSGKEN